MMVNHLFAEFFDDSAIFPPGNAPIPLAVEQYFAAKASQRAQFVGPLVINFERLPVLGEYVDSRADNDILDVSLTVPFEKLDKGVNQIRASRSMRLASVEVALGTIPLPTDLTADIEAVVDRSVRKFFELPWDSRGSEAIALLAKSSVKAKLRTGGIRADLYPSSAELADRVAELTRRDVPFKATAGLHHAIRNTDIDTGFEQQGFLNLALAVGAAAVGASSSDVTSALEERDAVHIANQFSGLDAQFRERFMSVGTCDVFGNIAELEDLDLLG